MEAKRAGGTIDSTGIASHNGGVRWKRILLIGAIAVVVGGVGLGTTLLYTYHKQTELDRSDPEVVLIRYLDATFERKDPAMAGLYTCSSPSGLAAINDLRADLERREKTFGVTIVVTSGRMTKDNTSIGTDLRITANKNGAVESESSEPWRFTMKDEDGWRVCGAARVPRPSPSPSVYPSAIASVSPSAVPSAG
jgi:hypothetical protein